MRILVTGSRDWDDPRTIHAVLTGLYAEATVGHLTTELSEFVLIEGGARGADAAAREWARSSPMHSHNQHPDQPKFEHRSYPADWQRHGKTAGPIRNARMLEEGKPEVVWAFISKPLEHSCGTRDLVTRARAAGIPVYVVER